LSRQKAVSSWQPVESLRFNKPETVAVAAAVAAQKFKVQSLVLQNAEHETWNLKPETTE
jgi:hypothetical protein